VYFETVESLNDAYEWFYVHLPVEFRSRLLKFHANIGNEHYRSASVKRFSKRGGAISIVGATGASLGKGVDKPDVRAVIMWGAPKDVEDYIQMVGRAARDKTYGVAMTIMYYFHNQVPRSKRFYLCCCCCCCCCCCFCCCYCCLSLNEIPTDTDVLSLSLLSKFPTVQMLQIHAHTGR
jgi:hypothetical protein